MALFVAREKRLRTIAELKVIVRAYSHAPILASHEAGSVAVPSTKISR